MQLGDKRAASPAFLARSYGKLGTRSRWRAACQAREGAALDVLQQGAQALLGLVLGHPYLALFALVLIEEAGVPLPISGDLLLVYAGYLVGQGQVQPFVIFGIVLGAVVIGAMLPYSLARAGGLRLVRRFGHLVHFSERRSARVEGWLARYHGRAIVLGRQVPGGRVPTSVMSGLFRVPFLRFLIFTGLGAAVWACLLLTLGAQFGEKIVALAAAPYLPGLALAAAGALALFVLVRRVRRAAS